MPRILPIGHDDDPGSAAARRPFFVRVLDQLVPSIITAFVLGFAAFKVFEVKVDGLVARDSDQQTRIERNSIELIRTQERQAALAERFNSAVQRTDIALDRLDARLTRMENRNGRERGQ